MIMDRHFVTIGDCGLLSEAETYKVLLLQEGFEVFLRDAELANTNWFMGNAYGYIKIQVPNDQAEAAATFLQKLRDKHRARQDADADADTNSGEVCLACGAEMTPTETTCQACGWSYGTSQEDQEQEDEDSP